MDKVLIPMHWQVDDWSVDGERNTISRASHEVTLSPRLTDLMVYLANHAGHVVSRDELVTHVWHRAIVTDQAVNQSIFELRKALRDGRTRDESPDYIHTVSKRGYVLVAKVRSLDDPNMQEAALNIEIDQDFDSTEKIDPPIRKYLWAPMLEWLDGLWRTSSEGR